MRSFHIAATFALCFSSVVAQAASDSDPQQFEQRCRDQYAKMTNTPETAVSVKYSGRDDSGRHIVKGTATIHGKEQPVQCIFGDPPKADAPAKK